MGNIKNIDDIRETVREAYRSAMRSGITCVVCHDDNGNIFTLEDAGRDIIPSGKCKEICCFSGQGYDPTAIDDDYCMHLMQEAGLLSRKATRKDVDRKLEEYDYSVQAIRDAFQQAAEELDKEILDYDCGELDPDIYISVKLGGSRKDEE